MAGAVNRMSQNVRTKALRVTIFLSSQDKIRRDKRMLCRKKRLITSHKRAGDRAKGSHRRDGRSRRFQTVVGSTSHAPACLKMCANTTAKICLSDPGHIAKMAEILYVPAGAITDREHDHVS